MKEHLETVKFEHCGRYQRITPNGRNCLLSIIMWYSFEWSNILIEFESLLSVSAGIMIKLTKADMVMIRQEIRNN